MISLARLSILNFTFTFDRSSNIKKDDQNIKNMIMLLKRKKTHLQFFTFRRKIKWEDTRFWFEWKAKPAQWLSITTLWFFIYNLNLNIYNTKAKISGRVDRRQSQADEKLLTKLCKSLQYSRMIDLWNQNQKYLKAERNWNWVDGYQNSTPCRPIFFIVGHRPPCRSFCRQPCLPPCRPKCPTPCRPIFV